MMNRLNILIIADYDDVKHLDLNARSNYWNIHWKIIDYNKLYKKYGELKKYIEDNKIDIIIYTRNDQVINKITIGRMTKKLMIGYSSISGVDERFHISELKSSFRDLLECNNKLIFNERRGPEVNKINGASGNFSIIFDTEQIGEARYSLPRILDLLDKYDVKATFFITNIMKKVYRNILDEIRIRGHEAGIHGINHDYLSLSNRDEQIRSVKYMINDFDGKVYGANFIGRMNSDTLDILIQNNMTYFVYPAINYYKYLCYPKIPTYPSLISSQQGDIRAIPICVETYNQPWFSLKNMIDVAFNVSRGYDRHITILCHSFRDGNLQNISVTEKLLQYLILEKKLMPILLKDLPFTFYKSVNKNDFDILTKKMQPKDYMPSCRQDWVNILPQNAIFLYKIARTHHVPW